MNSKNRLGHIIHCLVEHRKLWLMPAIAGLVLSTFYAFFIKGETWTSRQSMIIRDDLLGQTFKPGSFISQEAMKSAQETALETARRPEVIRRTLEMLGPDKSSFLGMGGAGGESWPSDKAVEDFRGAVSFESANGGEFGQSEVIVLAAKGSSPKRSVEFLTILTDEVDRKLSEIQGDRFQSMESELRATRNSTMLSRQALESDLIKMESEFEGSDIHLIRSLNESGGGSPSASENKLNEIATQRRDAVRKSAELQSLRQMMIKASRDSNIELPTSAELLASQPALAEMLTGMAKAKQDLAQISSSRQAAHPEVKSARENVASIKRQIQTSIGTVIHGLESQIEVQNQLVSSYDELRDKHTRRLSDVSRKRVPYATLSRQVEKLNEAYSEANSRLTMMQSRKQASDSIKLLTRIGEPWIGTRADGMGKRALSLIGGIAGLFIGLGMVMIVAPPFVEPHLRDNANASIQTEEEAVMQELGDIIPRHREEEVAAVKTTPAPAPEPVPEPVLQESELVVDREVVPQPEVELPPQPAAPIASAISAAAISTAAMATGIIPPAVFGATDVDELDDTARVEEPTDTMNSRVEENIQTIDELARPEVEPQTPVAQQPLPPQSPSMVVISDAENTDLQYPATIVPQQTEVPTTPESFVSDTAARPVPPTRPGANTIAAIFANMPQPKTDLVDSQTSEPTAVTNEIADKIRELTDQSNAEQTRAIERDASQTVMLDGDLVTTALPLQRRSSARPVDLAKADESDFGQQSIDQVFSQLTPPKQLPQQETDIDVDGQE